MRKFLLVLAIVLFTSIANAAAYYVSTSGNNSDGTTWVKAWSELNQINWGSLNAGDVVYLDGGVVSMTYETTLTVGGSGSAGNPIEIRASEEVNHDGIIYIRGSGYTELLPYVGNESSYGGSTFESYGISIGTSYSWVLIDGGDWGRIKIWAWRGEAGIYFSDNGSDNITLRYLEIYDNGKAMTSTGYGIRLGSNCDYVTIENCIIHDNHSQNIRGAGPIDNLVVRRTWIYNSRPSSVDATKVFNDGRSNYAFRIFGGGAGWGPLLFEDCIFGPCLVGNVFPTDIGHYPIGVDFVNCLFLGYGRDTQWHGYLGKDLVNTNKDHDFTNCTFWGNHTSSETNHIVLHGTGHNIEGCIFDAGRILSYDGTPSNLSCMTYESYGGGLVLGLNEDPNFKDDVFTYIGADDQAFPDPYNTFGHDWDFEPQNANCFYGDGSNPTMGVDENLVTVAAFFGTPVNISPTCSITAPSDEDFYQVGDNVAVEVTAVDSDGTIQDVKFYLDAVLQHTDSVAPYGWTYNSATVGSKVISALATDDDSATTSDSLDVHIQQTLSGLSWEAEAGTIISPLSETSGLVFQIIDTPTLGQGGELRIDFVTTISTANYIVKVYVNAESSAANSYWVMIDQEPSDNLTLWDIVPTIGLQQKTVTWRGSGDDENNPQYDPKVWTLTAGDHYILFVGREPNCKLDRLEIFQLGQDPNDTDSDGLTDSVETSIGTNINNPDTDGDGITDGLEYNTYNSDPLDSDSDSDGMPDGWEIDNLLNPNFAADANFDQDGDGYTNLAEYSNGTDPNVSDLFTVVDILTDLLTEFEQQGCSGVGAMPMMMALALLFGWCLIGRKCR